MTLRNKVNEAQSKLAKGGLNCKQIEAVYKGLDAAMKSEIKAAKGKLTAGQRAVVERAAKTRREVFREGRSRACKSLEIKVNPRYEGGRPQWGNHGVRSQADTIDAELRKYGLSGLGRRTKSARKMKRRIRRRR